VVHQLANTDDLHPMVIEGRMRLLERSLEGNARFHICGALNNTTLAGSRGSIRPQPSKANYITLGEMKLSRNFRENRNGDDVSEQCDGGTSTYERYILAMRTELTKLPRENFQHEEISEVEWFNMVRHLWNRILKVDNKIVQMPCLSAALMADRQRETERRRRNVEKRAEKRRTRGEQRGFGRREESFAIPDRYPPARQGHVKGKIEAGPRQPDQRSSTEAEEERTGRKSAGEASNAESDDSSSLSSSASWRHQRRKQSDEDEWDEEDEDVE